MYYQVDDDTRARVCVRVSVLCVCLCMCVFEPTQPLQREFNYDMGSRIKKKKKKKKKKEKIIQSLDNSDTSVFVLLRWRW